ncbi:exonuclease SbcCD subunit D [Longispora albida]|uniref:exonuclease SbcCD subunit D n=1 Tax=Longispora albida TaxID=203523 RepID=UPI00035F8CF7|nr:exonuclease SbcCD subunit D [Longispora albida]
MKILHTSDWHVGKVLKGNPRAEEHIRVLKELVDLADAERPDLVIVAGDLYDTAAPSAESQRIVIRTLSALRRRAGAVVAIAGNHDNGAELEALRGWATAAGIDIRGAVSRDLVVTGITEGGEPWRCLALPWLSQRFAVRATEMFDLTSAEADQLYADHVGRLITELTKDQTADSVNLITAHLTVVGGRLGGGEREAHTIAQYAVPTTLFPASTHYVALGHLHRRQEVPGPSKVHYSGSPLAIDFGEADNTPGAVIVEVTPDTPARVRAVPMTQARELRTVRGTLEQLRELDTADAWVRVFITEKPRAGLREEVQAMLPNALDIRIDPEVLADAARTQRSVRAGRSARELFRSYLTEQNHDDPAVADLFDKIYTEMH